MALSLVCNTLDANQRNRCVINIDGRNTVLYVKLRWHSKTEKWLMTVFDEQSRPVLRNIPLVSSFNFPTADLLRQFEYLFIGHAEVFPFTVYPITPNPARDNLGLGLEWGLFWGLPDE